MVKRGEGIMKEKKFTCDEEILKWLTEKNLSGIIKGINQNKGIINEKIASVIYCRSFIKKFEDEYNKIFNSLGFKIFIYYKYWFLSYFRLIQRNAIQTTTLCVC